MIANQVSMEDIRIFTKFVLVWHKAKIREYQ